MVEIISWLGEVEKLAKETYTQAAAFFAADPELKQFLGQIAEDEDGHCEAMRRAAEYITGKPPQLAAVSVDREIRDKVINYFSCIKKGIDKQAISMEDLLVKIGEAEFSEWNDIFIYVVNSLKKAGAEFIYSVAAMQAHLTQISLFLEKKAKDHEIVKKIKTLPIVWTENILIVDDDEMITTLLKALLNRDGNIDAASNGEEALKLIEAKYYKLVIADIAMPVMDGLTLYREAVSRFPKLKSRFLFMTGSVSPEAETFFAENNLKYLLKPASINVLRAEAMKIILSR